MQPRWYLLLKGIIPDSTNKTPEEQVAMLPKEYEVPTTIAEMTKSVLVFRKTGTCPNLLRWAACAERMVKTDKLADAYVGNVSCIGYVNGNGLYISSWDGKRECSIGVGASRKLRIL